MLGVKHQKKQVKTKTQKVGEKSQRSLKVLQNPIGKADFLRGVHIFLAIWMVLWLSFACCGCLQAASQDDHRQLPWRSFALCVKRLCTNPDPTPELLAAMEDEGKPERQKEKIQRQLQLLYFQSLGAVKYGVADANLGFKCPRYRRYCSRRAVETTTSPAKLPKPMIVVSAL